MGFHQIISQLPAEKLSDWLSRPGRMLLEVLPIAGGTRWNYRLIDYDRNTSLYFILNADMFSEWVEKYCDFSVSGHYVIEGVYAATEPEDIKQLQDGIVSWDYLGIRLAARWEITLNKLKQCGGRRMRVA